MASLERKGQPESSQQAFSIYYLCFVGLGFGMMAGAGTGNVLKMNFLKQKGTAIYECLLTQIR